MPIIIINFIRALAPYLLGAIVLLGAFLAGEHRVQRQWDFREAEIKAESNRLLLEAHDHNARIQQSLEASAQIIGETYEQNAKRVDDLADRNRQLLADRLQQSKSSGDRCAVPNAAAAAGIRDDLAAGTDAFLQSAGAGLVAESARADAVSESLRACQAYITAIQQQFGG